MELNDLIVLGVLTTVISAFVCVLAALITHTIRNRDVNDIYRKMESLEMLIRGNLGNQARAAKAERMEAAMLEAGQIMQNVDIVDKKAELIKLAGKYPDIAMQLAKKYIGL